MSNSNKRLIYVLLIAGMVSVGCAKQSAKDNPSSSSTQTQGNGNTNQNNNNGNSSNSSNELTPEQEQQALDAIAKMTQKECQESFQKLIDFYQATKGLSDEQRKAYFESLVADAQKQGLPAPPPPLPIDSKPYLALEACAKGTK